MQYSYFKPFRYFYCRLLSKVNHLCSTVCRELCHPFDSSTCLTQRFLEMQIVLLCTAIHHTSLTDAKMEWLSEGWPYLTAELNCMNVRVSHCSEMKPRPWKVNNNETPTYIKRRIQKAHRPFLLGVKICVHFMFSSGCQSFYFLNVVGRKFIAILFKHMVR